VQKPELGRWVANARGQLEEGVVGQGKKNLNILHFVPFSHWLASNQRSDIHLQSAKLASHFSSHDSPSKKDALFNEIDLLSTVHSLPTSQRIMFTKDISQPYTQLLEVSSSDNALQDDYQSNCDNS
jgi:hypothetical protein